ncbi:uncharacterized protein CTRU02_213571 [Colletotrichum truncatum]|uniref:Uncharacterized protein n=1 Tax=Colletotrichum truncatum TaxID=5467 RepID=A0ACC3YG68_COLTU
MISELSSFSSNLGPTPLATDVVMLGCVQMMRFPSSSASISSAPASMASSMMSSTPAPSLASNTTRPRRVKKKVAVLVVPLCFLTSSFRSCRLRALLSVSTSTMSATPGGRMASRVRVSRLAPVAERPWPRAMAESITLFGTPSVRGGRLVQSATAVSPPLLGG